MSENKILTLAAQRLGLGEEPATYKKAEEFLRVLQTKGNVKNINDFAKAVLTLDLASSMMGIGFDTETALKLSGLKKSMYRKNLNIIEKVLELGKLLTVGEVCVQFSCTIAKELAEKIQDVYKMQDIVADFSHPQYVAASVYTACKLLNFKVQKSQFVNISHLKPSQWKELVADFVTFTSKVGLIPDGNNKNRNGRSELNAYENVPHNELIESPHRKQVQEKQIEDYQVWKERILREARLQLEMMET